MQPLDILSSPWAIVPDKLLEIRSIYSAHLRGEKSDVAAIEARIGKPLANEDQGYQVNNGVAVIPINGVMGKKMNLFSQISGGASTQLIERDVRAAIADPNVNSILLHIDSPGGTVDGTQTLSKLITEASEIKPVMSFADGVMASAAYWVGSAADEIVSSSDTTQIGSIGVVATHTDISQAQEKQGVKTTEISAGKYKRITSQHSPLTEEGEAVIQDQVNQLYTIFVDAVAENRGVPVDTVLEDMADGRVFLSKQAKKRGLIDHVADLETTILNMSTGVWPVKKAETKQEKTVAETEEMTSAVIREKHPEIAAELMNDGAKVERERIQACESASLPGHEEIVAEMKYDGKSKAADVALAIVGAEKTLRASHLQDFQDNAPKTVPLAAVPAIEKESSSAKTAKERWDSNAELQAEFDGDFAAYEAYQKAADGGRLKILGGKA